MRWGKSLAVLLGFALLLGLRSGHAASEIPGAGPGDAGQHAVQRVLVFGDSLSAEYGLPRGSGWVSHMERRLQGRKQAYQIRNASISGDTTTGGLQRLPQVLKEFPADIVILELGANDGLRGLPVTSMTANLREMIAMSQGIGAKVLLIGQQIPPNYGRRYAIDFHQAYISLAEETGTALVPFMLEGIATDTALFLPDGLHPTVEAQSHIADTIWTHLEPLLK